MVTVSGGRASSPHTFQISGNATSCLPAKAFESRRDAYSRTLRGYIVNCRCKWNSRFVMTGSGVRIPLAAPAFFTIKIYDRGVCGFRVLSRHQRPQGRDYRIETVHGMASWRDHRRAARRKKIDSHATGKSSPLTDRPSQQSLRGPGRDFAPRSWFPPPTNNRGTPLANLFTLRGCSKRGKVADQRSTQRCRAC